MGEAKAGGGKQGGGASKAITLAGGKRESAQMTPPPLADWCGPASATDRNINDYINHIDILLGLSNHLRACGEDAPKDRPAA